MRVLWIGILLLCIVTAIVVIGSREENVAALVPRPPVEAVPRPTPTPPPAPIETTPVEEKASPEPEATVEDAEPETKTEPEPDIVIAPEAESVEAQDVVPLQGQSSDPDPHPHPDPDPAPAPAPDPVPAPADPEPADPDPPDPEPADPESADPTPPEIIPLATAGATLDEVQSLIDDLMSGAEEPRETSPPPAPDPPAANADLPVTDVKVDHNDDGTLLLDDRYTLKGSGTKEDPYRVSWELLISVSQTYDPRAEKFEIPGRVQLLHNKWARITGYIAFPLAGREVEEGLVMLNQWDGCCIGVPPSPFDGVEFRLAKPITMSRRHVVPYGTATGVLQVDPYLINGFLVGMYLMDDVEVDLGF